MITSHVSMARSAEAGGQHLVTRGGVWLREGPAGGVSAKDFSGVRVKLPLRSTVAARDKGGPGSARACAAILVSRAPSSSVSSSLLSSTKSISIGFRP